MRYFLRLVATVSVTLCTACVVAVPPDAVVRSGNAVRPAQPQQPGTARRGARPIVIVNDSGGNVLQAISRREELRASERPVEVRGYCRSACTIYISLPNACLAPDATVGFHAPRIAGTEIIPPLVDQMVAPYYRNGIRRMWMNEWRHSREMVKISAREFKRLDPQTRLCSR